MNKQTKANYEQKGCVMSNDETRYVSRGEAIYYAKEMEKTTRVDIDELLQVITSKEDEIRSLQDQLDLLHRREGNAKRFRETLEEDRREARKRGEEE